MNVLFILNSAPYGSEQTYNALRLAMALAAAEPAAKVRVFFMGDAVTAAVSSQNTPQGYYNIERMVQAVVAKGGRIKLCGTCCEARGFGSLPLVEGTEIGTMGDLARWTIESDKVLVF